MRPLRRSLVLVVGAALLIAAPANAQTDSTEVSWWRQLGSCWRADLQTLSLATVTGLTADSVTNPGNLLAKLPEHELSTEVRPDFRCDTNRLSLNFGPRLTQRTGVPRSDGTGTRELFVQNWTIRARPLPTVTASYGREVLQWGPSMLVSPSNPFYLDNGKGNPLREIPARQFFRAVWVPSSIWSISYITNTALGRGLPDGGRFRAVHAVKVDHRGDSFAATAIVSRPAGDRVTTGGSIQKTVNDAIVLYVEGSARHGNPALYPVRTAEPPGWQFLDTKRESNAIGGSVLVGGLYTTADGSTWNLEYQHNRDGYSGAEAGAFHAAAIDLDRIFASQAQESAQAAAVLASATNVGLRTLRRNYLFAQFLRTGIRDKVDLTLRYTRGLDDGSGAAVAFLSWSVLGRVQIVGLVTTMNGGANSEFGQVVHSQAVTGVRLLLR